MESEKKSKHNQEHAKEVFRIPIVWGRNINPTNSETGAAGNESQDSESEGWVRRTLVDFAPVVSACAALVTLGATILLTI